MAEWMPIETAPRDGTHILAAGGSPDSNHDLSSAGPVVIWFDASDKDWDLPDGGPGSWRFCSYDGGFYGHWEKPTHWMPLPPLPGGV